MRISGKILLMNLQQTIDAIMEFRKDYNWALIEEYKTYWNGYQNVNEFYSDLLGMEVIFNEHFMRRKMQAKGLLGITEVRLVDQNTIWFILYGKTKRSLECLESFNQDDLQYKCMKHRLHHSRNIVKIN